MEEQILFTRFYRSPAGTEPVREFLLSLSRDARLKYGSEVVYVHAIVKKQQKAARGDIELAQRRFDEWKVAQREQQERS